MIRGVPLDMAQQWGNAIISHVVCDFREDVEFILDSIVARRNSERNSHGVSKYSCITKIQLYVFVVYTRP